MSDYQGNIIIKNPATPTGPAENGSAPGIWKLSEALAFKRQGIWPTQGVSAGDPYFSYVSMLLSTTSLGNANNNLFVDSSGAFNPISRSGNTTQGSVTPYSTNWSNYFDGSGDYLSVPNSASLDFGTGDFTLEAWVYFNSLSGRNALFGGNTTGGFDLQLITPTNLISLGRSDVAYDFSSSFTFAVGQWYHVAITRASGTARCFVNGALINSAANSISYSQAGGQTLIGASVSGGSLFHAINGYVSNARIVKGTAVYTSAFTPSTTNLTAISGTSLLTCQSNRFRDASSNNFTITRNGDTRVTDFSPFSPGSPGITYNQSDITNWSGYFDGSGDYLAVPSTSALPTANQAYTIEAWIYPTTINTDNGVIGWGTYGTTNAVNAIKITSTQIFNYWWANDLAGNFTFTAGQWYHIVAQFDGTTRSLYVNGTRLATDTPTGHNVPSPVTNATIGVTNSTEYFTGSISNVRVITGQAIYSGASFTVPTSPLTAISGTSLLTLQNAAFTDNSTNKFVITPFGNVTVTGNSPFNTVGYWSNYFDGSGDYLTLGGQSAFAFGTGDFTIEGWVYYQPSVDIQLLTDWRPATTDGLYPLLYIDASGNMVYYVSAAARITSSSMPANTWNHFALARSGTSTKLFINGVQSGSTYSDSNNYLVGASRPVIGASGYNIGTIPLNKGYLSNVRVVKGTAVYTSNFTVPTTPLTAISGTSLLTCQASRLIDSSTNNFTITRTGDVSVQSFDPFYTSTIASNGGSMYFDGSGDELGFPISPAFTLGSSNFTIEGWLYPTSLPENSTAFVLDSSTYPRVMWIYTSGAFHVYASASGSAWQIDQTPAVVVGQWNHLVFQRNGNDFRTFLNGVLVATTTSALTFPAQRSVGYIGRGDNTVQRWNGYISNFRITTGSAIYSTGGFTPPTAPVTPTPATTLLVNGMNAGIYDATAINDMETVGNAQVTTAVSKFGGSSLYLDGTADYAVSPSSDAFGYGTGDFTIEFWLYLGAAVLQTVVSNLSGAAGTSPHLYTASDGSIRYYTAAGDRIVGSALSTGVWYHIAVSRASGSTKLFINGTQSGSTYADSNNYTTPSPLGIGTYWNGGSPVTTNTLNGYVDDLRITKGYARYTSSFTPPTQAFPTF